MPPGSLADATTDAQNAEAFHEAQLAWGKAFRTLCQTLREGGDAQANTLAVMHLHAFAGWVTDCEALLNRLYRENDPAVPELMAARIRRRVVAMESALAEP